jgi:hypothetical protein
MAISSFWSNPFGQNVADAGLSGPTTGLMGEPSPVGQGFFGKFQALNADPVKRDALMAFAGQLLAGGGYSPVKQSGSEIFGRALLASQQARAQAQEQIEKKKLQEAQIRNLDEANRKPLAVMGPDGNPIYTTEQEAIGKQPVSLTGGAEPPASIQEWQLDNQQRIAAGLPPRRLEEWLRTRAQMTPINPTVQMIGNVPTLVQPTRANPASPTVTPLSTLDAEAAGAQTVKGAEATGKATGERYATQIDNGLQAADSTVILRRGIELLDSVKTGGIEAAKLKATNLFGITGADEAELSANLGKAVLSQLRSTFGAAFTEREGERLQTIEANFGKSTEGNRRLLEQAQRMVTRVAERGARAAEATGDTETAQEIRESLKFSISPTANAKAPEAGTVKGGYRFKGGDPADKKNWVPVK